MAAAAGGYHHLHSGVHTQPEPVRLHWANQVALAGGFAMFMALVLVLTGIPARVLYDGSSAGTPTKPSSNPLSWTGSIDQNMRYLVAATGYEKGTYNWYISNVNDSEEGLPGIAEQLDGMGASVKSMDASLLRVLVITQAMSGDMEAMASGTRTSAATMNRLRSDVEALSGTMAELYLSTDNLTQAMARIDERARGIADNRTSAALKLTKELNGAMPADVPAPQTSLDPDGAA